MNYINPAYGDLDELAKAYQNSFVNADPFPNIHFRNFFNEDILQDILEESKGLEKTNVYTFKSPNEVKIATKGETFLGEKTKEFIHFLNSEPFLEFLQIITQFEEKLIPDPYLENAGLHEIKKGGFVKIHADKNKHSTTLLDRRVQLVLFLNKDWKESYGSHYELWDDKMKHCMKRVLPEFNTLLLFTTTDYSYHGSPDPLDCPDSVSNKSISLFYYSNGRPIHEINEGYYDSSKVYRYRNGHKNDNKMSIYNALMDVKNIITEFTPPLIMRLLGKRNKND